MIFLPNFLEKGVLSGTRSGPVCRWQLSFLSER